MARKLTRDEQAFRDAGAAAANSMIFTASGPVLSLRDFYIQLAEFGIDVGDVELFLRELGAEYVRALEEARGQIDDARKMARGILDQLDDKTGHRG